ncbi:8116_t:CDS:2, partial [Funneliformis mosseae]
MVKTIIHSEQEINHPPDSKYIERNLEAIVPEDSVQITFATYPGAIDCIKNLSTLSCNSDIYPEFFYQLSQMCHNIQSLGIQFRSDISNGLADLISVQQNLKYLTIHQSYKCLSYIVPLLTKHSTTLIRLQINGTGNYESLLFITNFINLRELILSFDYEYVFEDFRTLQDVTFPRLRILKFPNKCPNHEYLIKFLENNGKNLEEFDIDITDNSLNLAIAKFCPNLKSLFTTFLDDEVETLKTILHSCQRLEIIKVWCGVWLREYYLDEIELFDVVARHSPRNFCELRLCYPYNVQFEIPSVELETFFQRWKDRTPRKSLSFMIVGYILEVKEEIMKVIEEYIKLVACLPTKSKEVLYKNEIVIQFPYPKSPLFNYVSFLRRISIDEIDRKIASILRNKHPVTSRSVVMQEVFKMIMKQIYLKELSVYFSSDYISNIPFTTYPGATECLKDLTVLGFSSFYSEFFHRISLLSHNIQSLTIRVESDITDGLANLISSQQNLTCLSIFYDDNYMIDIADIISSAINLPENLTVLNLYGEYYYRTVLFISKFTNLRELLLSFDSGYTFEDFEELQHVVFPKLRVLKFPNKCPASDYLTKFLENNGKNLEEFYIDTNNSLNLAIAKFCPNMKSLFTTFLDGEVETLRLILNNCRQLESIKVWCGIWFSENYLNEKDLFDVIAKYSPKKLFELRLCYPYDTKTESFSDDLLENFFINWSKRVPRVTLSFVIVG